MLLEGLCPGVPVSQTVTSSLQDWQAALPSSHGAVSSQHISTRKDEKLRYHCIKLSKNESGCVDDAECLRGINAMLVWNRGTQKKMLNILSKSYFAGWMRSGLKLFQQLHQLRQRVSGAKCCCGTGESRRWILTDARVKAKYACVGGAGLGRSILRSDLVSLSCASHWLSAQWISSNTQINYPASHFSVRTQKGFTWNFPKMIYTC